MPVLSCIFCNWQFMHIMGLNVIVNAMQQIYFKRLLVHCKCGPKNFKLQGFCVDFTFFSIQYLPISLINFMIHARVFLVPKTMHGFFLYLKPCYQTLAVIVLGKTFAVSRKFGGKASYCIFPLRTLILDLDLIAQRDKLLSGWIGLSLRPWCYVYIHW